MKNNILKNYFFNIIMVFTIIVFPILLFPYASRVLTPVNFGKYSFAFSITSYFLVLATFGAQSYGVREISCVKNKSGKEMEKIFSEIIIITLITSLVGFLTYLVTVFFIEEFRRELALFVVVGLQILFGFLAIDYYFIAIENHKRRTIRLLIIRIVSLIALFLLVKKPQDYIIFAGVMVIPEIIGKLIDFYTVRKLIIFDIGALQLKKHIKPMMTFFFYVFSTGIYLNLDSTMLGFLKGDKEVAYYSVATKMSRIVIPLITSLGLVLTPRIIKNIKENKKVELFKDMDLYLNFIFFATIPIISVLMLCSDNLVLLFSGENYRDAILPMKLMLPIIFFISLSGFSAAQILIPTNNEKKVFKVSLIGLVANMGLNYLLIPKYSILGATIATLISELLVCIFRMKEVKYIFSDYKILSVERGQYFIFSLIAFRISLFIKNKIDVLNNFFQILIIGAIFSLIYLILLVIFKNSFVRRGLVEFKILKEKVEKIKDQQNPL